jgi:hypothetical protein
VTVLRYRGDLSDRHALDVWCDGRFYSNGVDRTFDRVSDMEPRDAAAIVIYALDAGALTLTPWSEKEVRDVYARNAATLSECMTVEHQIRYLAACAHIALGGSYEETHEYRKVETVTAGVIGYSLTRTNVRHA